MRLGLKEDSIIRSIVVKRNAIFLIWGGKNDWYKENNYKYL
jgi:hypothetical protein